MESVQEKKLPGKRKRPPRASRRAHAGTGKSWNAPATASAPGPPRGAWQQVMLYGFYPAMLVVVLAFLTIRPVMEPDTWFHMALGRHVVQTGEIPKVDMFSYNAAGNEWISSGWLSSVLLYLAYSTGGTLALTGVVFAVTAGTYLSLFFRSLSAGLGRGSMVALLLVVAATAYLRFTPRPEIFSQLFLVAVLLLLSAAGSAYAKGAGIRWHLLWGLPPLVAAWANFHAGFFVIIPGLLLFGAHQHLTSRPPRRLLHLWTPILLAVFAGLANPYGWRILTLPWKIKRMPGVAEHVYEWVPIFSQAHGSLPWMANAAYLVLVAFALVALLASYRRMPWWQTGVLLALLALPLYERRHIALAALAVPAILYPYLGWFDRLFTRRAFVLPALATSGLLILGGLMASGELQVGKGLLRAEIDQGLLPHRVTQFMREKPPPANLYNSYGPGGYLLYHLSPETKVFIDGRLDVYNPETWLDYLTAEHGSLPVTELASRYNLNSMLVYTAGMGSNQEHLAARVSNTPGWHLVYFDDIYALFVRESDATRPYIQRHAYDYVTPFDLGKMEKSRHLALPGDIEAELRRAVEESGGSAKAHLAAAVFARNAGREAEYREHLEAARRRNPKISLQ